MSGEAGPHEGAVYFSGTITGELVDKARAELLLGPSTRFNVLLSLASAAGGAFVSGLLALIGGVARPLALYLVMALLLGAGGLAAVLAYLEAKEKSDLRARMEKEGGAIRYTASLGASTGSTTQTGTPQGNPQG